jgi:hypothetical protein
MADDDLGSLLKETIAASISAHKKDVKSGKASLEMLEEGVDFDNARYVVNLISLWRDEGERSTVTKHKGTLKGAIEKAEEKFKKVNGRSDVQADVHVHVFVGERAYGVPKNYWKKFRERYKSE